MSNTDYTREDRDRLDQNTEEDRQDDINDWEQQEAEAKELLERRNSDDE